MFILPFMKGKLMKNWGDKAECMECNAEFRVYDPKSYWQCFLLAMNPENQQEIKCIISGGNNLEPTLTEWTDYELSLLYNDDGEGVQIDTEYRPRKAAEIWRKLNEQKKY